jgi:uncharacterized protein (TIGR00255 family)
MIHSMTGFGEAQLEEGGHAYHLEIRSVNNRYFKASTHLPEELAFLETEVERLLRQRLTRGSVTLRLRIRDLTAAAAAELNVAAIRQYVEQLRGAGADAGGINIDLATLTMLPGVCQPYELSDEQRERSWSLVQKLVEQALEKLIAMRASEGQALAADLRQHCDRIRVHLKAIRERAPKVIDEYSERLASRVRELIADRNIRLAEEDLLKEVSIFAERSDISEELSRLDAHLQQFDRVASEPEASGRKLEFVAQEMLREANTVGSKAGDSKIAWAIIEIKSAIDRIKEQVQNVE